MPNRYVIDSDDWDSLHSHTMDNSFGGSSWEGIRLNNGCA